MYKIEHSSQKWYNKERTYKRSMCHGQSWLYTAACKVIVRNQCTRKRPLKVNVTKDRIKRRSERHLWWWFNMTPFTLQTGTLVWIACWKWGILQSTVMFSDWQITDQIHFIPLTTSPIDETIQSGSWTPLFVDTSIRPIPVTTSPPPPPPPQDYEAMISLVQRLPQEHEVTLKAPIQYQFAFALNRRNYSGDREEALQVLEQVGGAWWWCQVVKEWTGFVSCCTHVSY